MITLKRVYEPASPEDGWRILVERLWPRGMKKAALRLDEWTKNVAPSDALRRWFGHDPARWTEFRRRYFAELDRKPDAWKAILQAYMDVEYEGILSIENEDPILTGEVGVERAAYVLKNVRNELLG